MLKTVMMKVMKQTVRTAKAVKDDDDQLLMKMTAGSGKLLLLHLCDQFITDCCQFFVLFHLLFQSTLHALDL